MSLSMMEPAVHEIEDPSEATDMLRDQLFQHLLDMNNLCTQVRSAADADESEDEVLADLYAELIETLEQHQEMISELSAAGEFEMHPEAATCSR